MLLPLLEHAFPSGVFYLLGPDIFSDWGIRHARHVSTYGFPGRTPTNFRPMLVRESPGRKH